MTSEPRQGDAWVVDFAGDLQAAPHDLAASAAEAEANDYDGVLVAETRHDPFISVALAAVATSRLTLTTAVAVALARSPMTVAVAANDVQQLSRGRFVLGLGSQVKPHIERRFSMPYTRPAARMEEYITALRAIWHTWATGEPLRFEGDFYRHTLMTPFFSPGPNPHGNPPIYLAGVGERMTEVAGRVADGFVAHTMTTPSYLYEVTLPTLARGRANAGRADEVVVSLPAFVAVAQDQNGLDRAVEAVRKQLAFYCSTPAYRPVLEHHGWVAMHEQLLDASRRGEWSLMPKAVNDTVLTTFAAVGTPEEVARRLDERFHGVVDRLSFSMPYAAEPALAARVAACLKGLRKPTIAKEAV